MSKKQNSNAEASVLRLVLPNIDGYTGSDDEDEHHDDHPRTVRLLVFLRLHDLLQALLHLRHSLVHVVVNAVHNRALLDHELVQVLEDLRQFLSTLRYT